MSSVCVAAYNQGRMRQEAESRQELERYAEILVRQANQLVRDLGVDVSGARTYASGSTALRQATDVYEQLDLTERTADHVAWERDQVDGRTGADIKDRLWKVREDLRRDDESTTRRAH